MTKTPSSPFIAVTFVIQNRDRNGKSQVRNLYFITVVITIRSHHFLPSLTRIVSLSLWFYSNELGFKLAHSASLVFSFLGFVFWFWSWRRCRRRIRGLRQRREEEERARRMCRRVIRCCCIEVLRRRRRREDAQLRSVSVKCRPAQLAKGVLFTVESPGAVIVCLNWCLWSWWDGGILFWSLGYKWTCHCCLVHVWCVELSSLD